MLTQMRLRTLKLSTRDHFLIQVCLDWCQRSPYCQGWTRHETTGLCKLKSTTEKKVHHPAWTWGTKCGTSCQPVTGQYLMGEVTNDRYENTNQV